MMLHGVAGVAAFAAFPRLLLLLQLSLMRPKMRTKMLHKNSIIIGSLSRQPFDNRSTNNIVTRNILLIY